MGISAYYEGRAYGPSVVQNPNGTLTMVFAGYRFPKSIVSAGSVLGDQATQRTTGGAASPTWTVGPNDLNMYRSILTTTLSQSTSPGVATTDVRVGIARPGHLRARPRCSRPRWRRWLRARAHQLAGDLHRFGRTPRSARPTSTTRARTRPVATTPIRHQRPTASRPSYAGDANYASSASTTPASVTINQATPTTPTISNLPSSGVFGGGFTATVNTNGDGTTSVTSNSDAVCTVSDLAVSYVGVGPCSLTAHVSEGTDYTAADGSPQTFQVSQAPPSTPTISNLPGSGTFGGGFTAQVTHGRRRHGVGHLLDHRRLHGEWARRLLRRRRPLHLDRPRGGRHRLRRS